MTFPKYMTKGTKEWHRYKKRLEESFKSQQNPPAAMFLTARMMKGMKNRAARVQPPEKDSSESSD